MVNKKTSSDIFINRLRAARDLRDLTQAGLAGLIKLPSSSITHFESGKRKPSLENLRRLVTALDISTDYLLGRTDDPFLPKASDQLHRDLSKLSVRDRELVLDFIKMLAGRSAGQSRKEEQLKRELRYRQIGARAEKLLLDENISSLPVPIRDLVHRYDINDPPGEPGGLLWLDLELNEMAPAAPNVSGALKMHSSIFFINYVSQLKGEEDQRFAIAHELGHIFSNGHTIHLLPDLESDTHFSQANYISADPYEREADYFASRLLMPQDLLRDKLANLQAPAGLKTIETIAKICQTPLAAAAIRYAELANDPVAVIISSGMAVTHCQLSKSMKAIEGVECPGRGVSIPPSSMTVRVYSDPELYAGAKYLDKEASLTNWLDSDKDNPTREEVASLGPCGRVLTVLTSEAEG